MKKVLSIAIIALSFGMTSCSETPCCDCTNSGSGLYSGIECYGETGVSNSVSETGVSNSVSEAEWTTWMENINCDCNQ